MNKSKQAIHRILAHYPLLHHTLASIFFNSIQGFNNNKPVLLEIDGNLLDEYPTYAKMTYDWWKDRLSSYILNYVSLAQTSVWIKLEAQTTKDIFSKGKYLYNCKSGCFEMEINSFGELAEIFAEFDGRTPSFIAHLFNHFPNQEYLTDVFSEGTISNIDIINDKVFINGLEPAPFKIIEVD